jgi:hypothetical protein
MVELILRTVFLATKAKRGRRIILSILFKMESNHLVIMIIDLFPARGC